MVNKIKSKDNIKPTCRLVEVSKALRSRISHHEKVIDDINQILAYEEFDIKNFIIHGGEDKEDQPEIESEKIIKILRRGLSYSLIFEGPAGIGKSTIVKFILSSNLENNEKKTEFLPVFIKLRDLANTDLSLYQYLDELLKNNISESIREHYIKEGNLILGLDGLDEVLISDKRSEVIEKIQRFIVDYPTAQLILSTRDSSVLTKGLFEQRVNFLVLRVEFFNRDQIANFIHFPFLKDLMNSSQVVTVWLPKCLDLIIRTFHDQINLSELISNLKEDDIIGK
ncbi:MAG: NACHT domain-containing protein [Candidatus Hodarchaeota archaeon]